MNGGGAAVVLVCTHDDEPTVADALESALEQSAPSSSYRVLVVDDGSSDATPRVAGRYARFGVELVRLPHNGGLAAACNAGLRRIDAPYYVRLDGDDRFERELMESLLETSRETGADIVVTDRFEEDPDGRLEVRRLADPPLVPELIAAGALLPTALVRELGGYRELFWEEFDLYVRLLESGRCRAAHVPRPLYTYRVGGNGRMTTDGERTARGWRELRGLWPEEVLARHGLDGFEAGVPGRAA